MIFRIRPTTAEMSCFTSCSQTRTTFHPSARNCAVTLRSRAMLLFSLSRQNSWFVFGCTPCLGHPCQKQPSMKTTSRRPANVMSGLPGSFVCSRYLRPSAHSARRNTSSGLVLRPLIRDMQRLRWEGVSTSILCLVRHPLTW